MHPARLPPVLWPLLFGNLVIGTGVMAVPGTLNQISESLQVSTATAGQLISAGALLMCLGAPMFATLVAGWDRRRLLSGCMLWYAVFHLLSALMPEFGSLLVMRVLALVAPAIFTPQAAACIGLLVPAAQRGRAVTFVFLGWSVASVLGMPLAALTGGLFGWRSAFLLVALCAAASALWVWRAMPDGIKPDPLSRSAWSQAFQSPALMLCVLVTALYSAGQFVVFSYFAPYFKTRLGVSPLELSALLAWFGVFGFVGNVWVSRHIDRLGAARSVGMAIACMVLSMAAWPMGQTPLLAALVMIPWALGCFASNSAQQARLLEIAPALATASIAMNTSAMYAGQALGAAGGGWLIIRGHMAYLSYAGTVVLLSALLTSGIASRAKRKT
jgi:predicted MFS family arabinose efflux permease